MYKSSEKGRALKAKRNYFTKGEVNCVDRFFFQLIQILHYYSLKHFHSFSKTIEKFILSRKERNELMDIVCRSIWFNFGQQRKKRPLFKLIKGPYSGPLLVRITVININKIYFRVHVSIMEYRRVVSPILLVRKKYGNFLE